MINSIQKLGDKSQKYIRDFLKNCSIEEKIDTHYIIVEIISANDIKIKKSNGNEIDRVDLILNSMWNKLFLDWNYLKLSNKEWFTSHIGYSIKMFYFPCDTPLTVTYDSKIRYVFDKVIYNGVEYDPKNILSNIKFPDVYNVDYKCSLKKVDDPCKIYSDMLNNLSDDLQITMQEVFLNIIDKENSKIFAANSPEGYIFKYGNKIYQVLLTHRQKIEQEKSSYEFLLSDFIKYCKLHNYTDKIGQSYTKTVCNLFNDYIINYEKQTHVIENNIDTNGIESPYLGAKFDLGYEYIPDQVTKTLCQESVLYKNIFKVLLANLRRGKDFSHCIYMSKREVDDWNNIMKSIKIRNIYI